MSVKWWVPDVRVNWKQWCVGVEFWHGGVYVYLGPIEMVW